MYYFRRIKWLALGDVAVADADDPAELKHKNLKNGNGLPARTQTISTMCVCARNSGLAIGRGQFVYGIAGWATNVCVVYVYAQQKHLFPSRR